MHCECVFFFFTTESQFAYIASTLENIQLADSITVPRGRPLVGRSVPSSGAKRRDQQEILPISSLRAVGGRLLAGQSALARCC